jgi:hypothetical protein
MLVIDGQMPLEGLTTLVSDGMGGREVWWRRCLFKSWLLVYLVDRPFS